MTTNYSFGSFINKGNNSNRATNNNRASYNSGRVSPATPKQKSYYLDLCKRKKVKPADVNSFTFAEMGKEIERLNALPQPASDRQINKIVELNKEIISAGGNLKEFTQEFLDSLTGGRNGSASDLIEKLMEMRLELNDSLPITDNQVQTLIDWFLCPDIPFESLSYEELLPLKPGANVQESVTHTISINKKVDLGDGKWRLMTANEFAEELKSKLTKKTASAIMNQYGSDFYAWRSTRVTKPQIELIRTLEDRLAQTHVPKEVEWAIIDGVPQQVTKPSMRDYYEPVAYDPLDELQLLQMSSEEAGEWIDRLQYELSNMQDVKPMFDEKDMNLDAQDHINETNRNVSDEVDARNKDIQNFKDLIFHVEALTGCQADEVHDLASQITQDDPRSKKHADAKRRIKEFFMSAITADPYQDFDRWSEEVATIRHMCDENSFSREIMGFN